MIGLLVGVAVSDSARDGRAAEHSDRRRFAAEVRWNTQVLGRLQSGRQEGEWKNALRLYVATLPCEI